MFIETILEFLEKVKKDRHAFMVKRKYISKDVKYSEELWEKFRNEWLSKVEI